MFKNSGSGQPLEIGERLDGTKKIYRLEQEKQASLTVLFRIAADQTSVLCRIFQKLRNHRYAPTKLLWLEPGLGFVHYCTVRAL